MASRQTPVADAQEGIHLGQYILPCYFSCQLADTTVISLAATSDDRSSLSSCPELRMLRTYFKKGSSHYLSPPNTSLPEVAGCPSVWSCLVPLHHLLCFLSMFINRRSPQVQSSFDTYLQAKLTLFLLEALLVRLSVLFTPLYGCSRNSSCHP